MIFCRSALASAFGVAILASSSIIFNTLQLRVYTPADAKQFQGGHNTTTAKVGSNGSAPVEEIWRNTTEGKNQTNGTILSWTPELCRPKKDHSINPRFRQLASDVVKQWTFPPDVDEFYREFHPSTADPNSMWLRGDIKETVPDWMAYYLTWHQHHLDVLWDEDQRHVDTGDVPSVHVEACTMWKCGGLADRLKGILPVLRFAYESKRMLLVYWGMAPHPIESFLMPPVGGMDWRLPRGGWIEKKIQLYEHGPVRQSFAKNMKDWPYCIGVTKTHNRAGPKSFNRLTKQKSNDLFNRLYPVTWKLLFTPSLPVREALSAAMRDLGLVPRRYVSAHVRARYQRPCSPAQRLGFARNAIRCASSDGGEKKTGDEAPAAAAASSAPNDTMYERDFDTSPTQLYVMVQKKQWSSAVRRLQEESEEARIWVSRKEKDGKLRWRLLPIHAAIVFRAPEHVAEALLAAYPKGAQSKDDQGMLPLHLTFRNGSTEAVANLLLFVSFPQSVDVKDRKDRIPLVLAQASTSPNTRRPRQTSGLGRSYGFPHVSLF